MPDLASNVINSLITGGFVTAALFFIFRELIKDMLSKNLADYENTLKKDLVTFTSELDAKRNIEFERWRKYLEQLGFEQNTLFAELYKKRVYVIPEIYARLTRVQRSFARMLDPLPSEITGIQKNEAMKQAADEANEFVNYFDENQLFLDRDLCAKISQLSQEFHKIYTSFYLAYRTAPDNKDNKLYLSWSQGLDTLNLQIPPLREEIEIHFRKVLGIITISAVNLQDEKDIEVLKSMGIPKEEFLRLVDFITKP